MANRKKHEHVTYKDSDTWGGRTFGLFTAIGLSRPRWIPALQQYVKFIRCRCECGQEVDRSPLKLEQGDALGCPGCLATRSISPDARALILEFFPFARRLARRRFPSSPDRDELESTAVATLVDCAREFAGMPRDRFKAYLGARVIRNCRCCYRRWARTTSLDALPYADGLAWRDDGPLADDAIDCRDLLDSGLSDMERLALELHFLQGETMEAVGEAIGRSKSGATWIVRQALAKVRDRAGVPAA